MLFTKQLIMSLQKPMRKILKQDAAEETPQNKIHQHKGEKSETTEFLNKAMP